MTDITTVRTAIEKEQMQLKLWNKFFRGEATRMRNEGQFRDNFSNQESPLFKGFQAYHKSCGEYSELLTQQVVKEVEQLSEQCASLLGKANELIRKASDSSAKAAVDKETAELRARLEKFMAAKQQLIQENLYLSLNYKLDVFCRGSEAQTAVLQSLKFPTTEETLKKIFG